MAFNEKSIFINLNATPCFAPNYASNCAFGNIKHFCKSGHVPIRIEPLIVASNKFNLFLIKFYVWCFFSITKPFSALINHIVRVVCGCPKKQVIGVATLPVIALMTYIKTIWYWPIREFPRHAVGLIVLLASHKMTPTVFFYSGLPFPTLGWRANFHLAPKTFFKCKTVLSRHFSSINANRSPCAFSSNHGMSKPKRATFAIIQEFKQFAGRILAHTVVNVDFSTKFLYTQAGQTNE